MKLGGGAPSITDSPLFHYYKGKLCWCLYAFEFHDFLCMNYFMINTMDLPSYVTLGLLSTCHDELRRPALVYILHLC